MVYSYRSPFTYLMVLQKMTRYVVDIETEEEHDDRATLSDALISHPDVESYDITRYENHET